ncbi:MAG: hypothetical protein AM324_002675 [Candidatus Thorarchaeota archaeon SMTZ1-83]|nr:MAG: hypothetical protein AM324_03690 [Candidatus Thorarchaeota archaeon SMTZ1-83]
MYLLIIILNKEEYLDDVLSVLIEMGITDVTIVDTQSLEMALAYRVPIFAGLKFQLGGRTPYSKTIFALADDKNTGKEIIELLKEVGIDLEEKGVARIVTIAVESVLGTPPEVATEI